MPGRQAHGRSLLANPKAKSSSKKSKSRSQKNALDAFGIAQEKFPTRQKKTPRVRELDAESERKHARDDDDDDQDEEGDGEPSRKKTKVPSRPAADDDAEYGSDSDGNEWRLGGLAENDEDSEIESDDAFGESDNEKFQGYSFRGTQTKKTEVGLSLGDKMIARLTALGRVMIPRTIQTTMRERLSAQMQLTSPRRLISSRKTPTTRIRRATKNLRRTSRVTRNRTVPTALTIPMTMGMKKRRRPILRSSKPYEG